MLNMNCKRNHLIILSVTCHDLGNFPPLIHLPSYPFVNFQKPYKWVRWVMQEWDGVESGGMGHAGVGWIMQWWGGSYRGGVV